MLEHIGIFNHKIVIIIACDETTVSVAEVLQKFQSLKKYNVLVRPNNKELGETAWFVNGLSFLESKDRNETTFYAHAKGVTHTEKPSLNGVKQWAEAMYRINLGSPARVEKALANHPCAGCLLFPNTRPWFYAGTFFWFRHDAVFGGAWRRIETTADPAHKPPIDSPRFAVERYLGRRIPREKAFSFFNRANDGPRLYKGIDKSEYAHVLGQ